MFTESVEAGFYHRFPDLSVFDCRPDLNVAKCALEAVQFAARGYNFRRVEKLVWGTPRAIAP